MDTGPTIELVLFRLRDGADPQAFLDANRAVASELAAMSGYLRRELLRAGDGQWVDVVYWRSLSEAQQAAETIMSRPAVLPAMEMIDVNTITMLHLDQLRVYP